jgi:hypothetical protein
MLLDRGAGADEDARDEPPRRVAREPRRGLGRGRVDEGDRERRRRRVRRDGGRNEAERQARAARAELERQ